MSGHLAVIPARAVTDSRIGNAGLRVLLILGTHTDKAGWCRVKQDTVADLLGIGRQAVSKQLVSLQSIGYVEAKRTGRSSHYRVVLDVPESFAMPPEVESDNPLMRPQVASDAPLEVASDAPPGGGIYRTTVSNDVLERRSTTCRPLVSSDRFGSEFWTTWPPRNGKRIDRAKAEAEWRSMTPAEKDAAVIGAGHLRDAIAAGGAFGPPDAWRWLRDKRWVDWQEPATVEPRPGSGPRRSVGDDNLARLQEWRSVEVGR